MPCAVGGATAVASDVPMSSESSGSRVTYPIRSDVSCDVGRPTVDASDVTVSSESTVLRVTYPIQCDVSCAVGRATVIASDVSVFSDSTGSRVTYPIQFDESRAGGGVAAGSICMQSAGPLYQETSISLHSTEPSTYDHTAEIDGVNEAEYLEGL